MQNAENNILSIGIITSSEKSFIKKLLSVYANSFKVENEFNKTMQNAVDIQSALFKYNTTV